MTATSDQTNIAEVLLAYFAAKNRAVLDETMAFFSPDLVTYTDSTLGWALNGFDQVRSVFVQHMPDWGDGRSLPIRILGDGGSAVVEFVDTRELFGGELHLLGSVDLEEGRIVRWVDVWDATSFDRDLFSQIATPDDAFPEVPDVVDERAAPKVAAVARELHRTLAENDPVALEGSSPVTSSTRTWPCGRVSSAVTPSCALSRPASVGRPTARPARSGAPSAGAQEAASSGPGPARAACATA